MSEQLFPYRDPAELERIELSGLHREGVFTVRQSYDYDTGAAFYSVFAGDCTPEGGADAHGCRYVTVYPGMAVEVWEQCGSGSLCPWIIENDGGVADVQPHRPRIKQDLKKKNVELRPPLV